MNKHIFWTVPVGVAAGLSLPFLLPAPKAKPAPPLPPAPVVSVEAYELRTRPIPKPYEETASDVASDPVAVATASAGAQTRLENNPDQDPSPLMRKRSTRMKRRPAPRISPTNLRRLQDEDNRAWQEANRMLMSERRGA